MALCNIAHTRTKKYCIKDNKEIMALFERKSTSLVVDVSVKCIDCIRFKKNYCNGNKTLKAMQQQTRSHSNAVQGAKTNREKIGISKY